MYSKDQYITIIRVGLDEMKGLVYDYYSIVLCVIVWQKHLFWTNAFIKSVRGEKQLCIIDNRKLMADFKTNVFICWEERGCVYVTLCQTVKKIQFVDINRMKNVGLEPVHGKDQGTIYLFILSFSVGGWTWFWKSWSRCVARGNILELQLEKL